jgi:hypothetical protein
MSNYDIHKKMITVSHVYLQCNRHLSQNNNKNKPETVLLFILKETVLLSYNIPNAIYRVI